MRNRWYRINETCACEANEEDALEKFVNYDEWERFLAGCVDCEDASTEELMAEFLNTYPDNIDDIQEQGNGFIVYLSEPCDENPEPWRDASDKYLQYEDDYDV